MTKAGGKLFQYKDHTGKILKLLPGKVVCVGRNYLEHVKELGNRVPDTPLLFIKPNTAIVDLEPGFELPAVAGPCHFETEIAVLIGQQLVSEQRRGLQQREQSVEIENAIAGYGIALDLTLRELQNQLKAKGHPWEIAKSFDGACPMGCFFTAKISPGELGLQCCVNGEIRQYGFASEMMVGIVDLIQLITQHFTLQVGDVVLTGTPAGVGSLVVGDNLHLKLLTKDHSGAVVELVEYNSRVEN